MVVFDDTKYNNVIGYFMPDGRVSCYHRNGGLHLLTNSDGGILMDEVSSHTQNHLHPYKVHD